MRSISNVSGSSVAGQRRRVRVAAVVLIAGALATGAACGSNEGSERRSLAVEGIVDTQETTEPADCTFGVLEEGSRDDPPPGPPDADSWIYVEDDGVLVGRYRLGDELGRREDGRFALLVEVHDGCGETIGWHSLVGDGGEGIAGLYTTEQVEDPSFDIYKELPTG